MNDDLEIHIEKLRTDLSLTKDKQFKLQLEHMVNLLLQNDFHRLVQLLYRLDVSETKLKDLLHANPQTDAAIIISELIIERQVQKLKFKQQYNSNTDIPDEEKW
jgi:hypothetical protein